MGTKTPIKTALIVHSIECEKRIPKHGDENFLSLYFKIFDVQ